MPYLHQWDYLFAFGTIFAALDAFNIGANDVANSFATSVSSRSLTLKQACCAAAVFEFLGAVLAGSRVAGTIKNGIIPLSVFKKNPGVELLAFVCALAASSIWLMTATKKSWPVSTTYSIVSAIAGVGVAIGGKDAVNWGWNNGKGLSTIFAGMLIAPGMAAAFAAILFLITKFAVLVRKDSVRAALFASPIYFFGCTAILTLSIVYKGAPQLKLNKLSKSTIALAICLTALVVALLSIIFWLPYVYCKVVRKDHTIRVYHFFYGPLLWWRPSPENPAQDGSHVPDYRVYKEEKIDESTLATSSPTASTQRDLKNDDDVEAAHAAPLPSQKAELTPLEQMEVEKRTVVGHWWLPRNLWIILRYKVLLVLTHGTSIDVINLQSIGNSEKEAKRIAEMHRSTTQYSNETEHLYSFLQVMTACTASFAHGSNDVANAVGPYAAIYSVWSSGVASTANSVTPVWIYVFGAGCLVVGLATYGYNIMRVLGNKLTLMSPSRGFSMELGSAITIIVASIYGIPVSTTMCITGATLGVGLCNGDIRTFNWRGLAWIVAGWILTVPVVGTAAGCLMGIILNAPHFA